MRALRGCNASFLMGALKAMQCSPETAAINASGFWAVTCRSKHAVSAHSHSESKLCKAAGRLRFALASHGH